MREHYIYRNYNLRLIYDAAESYKRLLQWKLLATFTSTRSVKTIYIINNVQPTADTGSINVRLFLQKLLALDTFLSASKNFYLEIIQSAECLGPGGISCETISLDISDHSTSAWRKL